MKKKDPLTAPTLYSAHAPLYGPRGDRPLHLAAQNGHGAVLACLVAAGAALEARAELTGQAPQVLRNRWLNEATEQRNGNGSEGLVRRSDLEIVVETCGGLNANVQLFSNFIPVWYRLAAPNTNARLEFSLALHLTGFGDR